jgi:hypothetical protein
MGGRGSGNRWRWSTKETCESMRRIGMPFLKKRGFLRPGTSGKLNWSVGGEPSGNVNFTTHAHGLELRYRVSDHGSEDYTPIAELLPFTFTNQHLGGERRWFRCLSCNRRCAVLYGGARFRCRKCYNLAYATQNDSVFLRGTTRAQRIREKLGGSLSMDDPFPSKPKGMHWKTYRRYERHGAALEHNIHCLDMEYLKRLVGM